MGIVSSAHSVGPVQIDGRSTVTEWHTDSVGVVYRVEYIAVEGTDYVAVRDARATRISDDLAEAEAAALLG